jgi:outer membrane usher protein
MTAIAEPAYARAPPHAILLKHQVIAALLKDDVVTSGAPAEGSTQTTHSIVSRGPVDVEAPLIVNDRLVGEIDVRVDANGAGDVDAQRLLQLLGPVLDPALLAALREKIGNRPRADLLSLAIAPMQIAYDPAALELRLSLPADRLQTQALSFRGYENPDPTRFQPQARYAGGIAIGATQRIVESGLQKGRAPLLLSADGFATFGAFPGVTVQGGGLFTENPGHGFKFQRSLTRASYDDFADAVHYVAGEFNPALTGFQGGAAVLGLGIARDYAGIRPFENIRPSGRGGVILERPSTVIVEVNGLETRRLQLQPGRYELTDLSAVSGANDVRLFVQDDLGRREVAATSFFSATSILAEGLADFGVAIGKRQSRLTEYGGPLTATGYIRRGLTGNLTLGAGAQYAASDWQTDAEAVVGTPIGLFRAQAAFSRVGGRSGTAFSLDWLETFRTGRSVWNFTILSSLMSRDFASPFDRNGRANDRDWSVNGRIDWRRDDIGLSLVTSLERTRSHTEQEGVDLTAYYAWRRLAFTGTVGVDRFDGGRWGPRALLGISIQLGRRDNATIRVDTRRDTAVAEVARYPIDQVGDLSGRLQLTRDDDHYGIGGDMRYFGNRFIASAEQSLYAAGSPRGIDTRETIIRASTFLGIADGAIAIGRPTPGNFAIYRRHASLAGSSVVVTDEAGLVVGKQDWLGSPLVPFNRSYSPVYHSYEVEPLPSGYDLGDARLSAFPGAFSGYRVTIGSDASRVAIGYLISPDGPISEQAGTAERIDGKGEPRPFFTNATGRFAVDGLSPGTWRLMIDGREVARFTISANDQGMIDVGKLFDHAR